MLLSLASVIAAGQAPGAVAPRGRIGAVSLVS
jgi:hypothetical protein